MNDLIHYSPTDLITFEVTKGRQTTTHLHLRNVSKYPVVYKVKTTHIKRYCVRPNAAIIEPYSHLDVQVVQQAFKSIPADFDSCTDKFLLQVARLDHIPGGQSGSEMHGYDSVMQLWGAVPSSVTYKTKFRVFLKRAEAAATSTSAPKSLSGGPVPVVSPFMNVSDRYGSSVAKPTSFSPTAVISRESHPTEAAHRPPMISSAVSPRMSVGKPPVISASPGFPHQTVRDVHTRTRTDTSGQASDQRTAIPSEGSRSHKAAAEEPEVDYRSVEYARERALAIRIAPRIPVHPLDEATRQCVAVERAGELVRVINGRQVDIDNINRDLAEARHKLSDARMATRPAYDVRYEVSESASVPYAQIAIMALISGALLQFFV